MDRNKGFTLAEALVTIIIVAILLAIGLPGLAHIIRSNRSAAVSNQILSTLLLARRNAVDLGTTTTLCGSIDGAGCTGSWNNSWILFSDYNANGTLNSTDGDAPLRLTDILPAGYTVTWRCFGPNTRLQFEPTGTTRWQNGTFYICPPDNDPAYARAVVVYLSGRVRLSTDSDGDGVHERADGDPITCP